MSAEQTAAANAIAASYRLNHTLLDGAATTVAGGQAEAALSGEHIIDIQGSFATAATVNIYVKRATAENFVILRDLSTDLPASFTKAGSASYLLGKGDKVYAQLSGITGTPAINATMTFIKN